MGTSTIHINRSNLRWDGRNSVGGELPMEHTSLRLMLKTASLAKVERYIYLNENNLSYCINSYDNGNNFSTAN